MVQLAKMSLAIWPYFWKIFVKLSAPIQGLLIDILMLVLMEFMKLFMYLLLLFAFSYLIFYVLDTSTECQEASTSELKSERLSAGLMEDGSFSKYPFVVELPAKASAELLKTKKLYSNEKLVASEHKGLQ